VRKANYIGLPDAIRFWLSRARCLAVEIEGPPKAAEDCRSPIRCRAVRGRTVFRKVLDCASPLALLCVTLVYCSAASKEASNSGRDLSPSFPVTINVNAGHTLASWRPMWRFFGADEPNYATMRDGKKLLGELGALAPNQVYFRAHNLLTSGDGTPALKWGSTGAYSEDAEGKPVYNWTIVDGIFDTYLKNGLRPYAQIGFMPKELSTRPEPYQHHWDPSAKYNEIFTGWAYPPKDFVKWGELVYQWAKHCVNKYGAAEVEHWYWEVWNEPNIGYWHGSPEQFQKLHDYAMAGVRRALPTARVGGPDVAGAGGKFMRDFLEHCLHGTNYATGKDGTPLDFVSFHAKGAPSFIDGHVRMGIANQLRAVDSGFEIVGSFPELRNTPIVIGESDPDGCAACQGPQLGYRNGTMYSSYTAASFARKLDLADRHKVNLAGALTWAFEFEEKPWFAGFRVLASNGVDLPVLNVFRMFSRLGGSQIAVESDHAISLDSMLKDGVRAEPDIAAIATLDTNRAAIMVWHYHDDDLPGPTAEVLLKISQLPTQIRSARLEHFRIDADHSNAFTGWQRLGSPQQPTPEQYRQLEKAGQLQTLADPQIQKIERGTAMLKFALPRQAVSLLVLNWQN